MDGLETIGKKWTKKDGEVRYYVNDWKDMIGLEVEYYKTGNVSNVVFRGEQCSNCWFKKYVASTKVWISEDKKVHVDYCKDGVVENAIIEALEKKIAEVFAPKSEGNQITLQAHDRHGWDTETMDNMDDVHAFLRHAHKGPITAYIGGKMFTVPVGIGKRVA